MRKREGGKRTAQHRARYRSRVGAVYRPRPRIVVVCDDKVTAPRYFKYLQDEVKAHVALQVVPRRASCDDSTAVIAMAKQYLDRLHEEASDDSEVGSVWALIDVEGSSTAQASALQAKERGELLGVSVALSKPCFEVWTLLHLEDTGALFADCNAVLSQVKTEWRKRFNQDFGKKTRAEYSRIIKDRLVAAERARRHHSRNPRDPSWTEVYLLISEIENLVAQEHGPGPF